MFSYYDSEFQPEMRRADVERELARGRVHTHAAPSRPRPGRERVAAALLAGAAWLAPVRASATLPVQATCPSAWR